MLSSRDPLALNPSIDGGCPHGAAPDHARADERKLRSGGWVIQYEEEERHSGTGRTQEAVVNAKTRRQVSAEDLHP